MANLNRVFLMGNLTRDPELRYAPSGLAIVTFSMAINREWTSKDGEKKEEVCYVEVNAFGRTAEVIAEYFEKGKPIFVEGRLVFNQWEDKDGRKRSVLKVAADSFQFIGGNGGGGQNHQKSNIPNNDIEEEVPF